MNDFDYLKEEEPDIRARAERLQKALSDFQSHYYDKFKSSITYMEDAPMIISGVYFTMLSRNVRKYVPKRINKFKMASILEIAIVRIQPIQHEDAVVQRSLNGDLAFYCALSLAVSMPPSHFEKNTSIKQVEDLFDSLKRQHVDWLKNKELLTQPIFSNGAFLCLLFMLYKSEQPAMSHT